MSVQNAITIACLQHTTKFGGQAARHRAKDSLKHYRAAGVTKKLCQDLIKLSWFLDRWYTRTIGYDSQSDGSPLQPFKIGI